MYEIYEQIFKMPQGKQVIKDSLGLQEDEEESVVDKKMEKCLVFD